MKWYGFGLLVLAGGLAAARPAMAGAPLRGFGLNNGNHGGQGYLGIDIRDVSEENLAALRLHDVRGAEIIRVDHDGPAGKMGLREHDVVLQMNGAAVTGEEVLRRMLRDTAPGRTVTLLLSRDGQQITATAQMGDRSEVEREAFELHLSPANTTASTPPGPQAPASALPTGEGSAPVGGMSGASGSPGIISRYGKSLLPSFLVTPTYTGVVLEMMGPQLAQFFAVPGGTGLLVRSVENNSPAAMAGLKAGDIVTKTNFMPVGSPSRWTKTVREAKGRPITVTIVRDRQERTMTIVPDSKKHSELMVPGVGLPGVAMEPVVYHGEVTRLQRGEL